MKEPDRLKTLIDLSSYEDSIYSWIIISIIILLLGRKQNVLRSLSSVRLLFLISIIIEIIIIAFVILSNNKSTDDNFGEGMN